MGIIITPQEKIDEYFESSALSQSKLKKLLQGFDNFLADQQQDKSYFAIGSAVDCILTGEKEEFEKQFYVSKLEKKPSEVEMQIITQVADELSDNNVLFEETSLLDCDYMLLIAADEVGWQKNWKNETRVKKLVEKGHEYFEDLKKSVGKIILSAEQKTTIDNVVMSLTTNSRTKKYFDRQQQEKLTDVDFYYQLPIYFEYQDTDCKALLDLLVVIKQNGKPVALEPIDLKTMSGNTFNFVSSVKKLRYDIQASWYTQALKVWSKKVLEAEDVLIKPFKFIVESTTNSGRPLVYELTDSLLEIGLNGREGTCLSDVNTNLLPYGSEITLTKEIKGLNQLMEEFLFYEGSNWTEDKRLLTSNGQLKLNWEGIIN